MAPPRYRPLLLLILLSLFPSSSSSIQPLRRPSTSVASKSRNSPPSSRPPLFPLAAALFVLGDSTVDSGTNNHLVTLARANRPPYGRDFDTHLPTGRFSNGRVVVDFLAERLGLPFVPPYLNQTGRIEDMIHGLNYASAAAGILSSSGSDLGQHISLTQQIQQFMDTFRQLRENLGDVAARDFLARSIFYISIGSNDFIHSYFSNTSNVNQSLLPPWDFNRLLINIFEQHLKNLYEVGVRKMVVMGLAPLGCTPHYLWDSGSRTGECADVINDVVVQFNYAMRLMIDRLSRDDLPAATITFCDAFEGSMDILANHRRYGFVSTRDACCGLGKFGGMLMCLLPEMACSDASRHVWWDEFHPTDAVNAILAGNVWDGEHTAMCHPFNLKELLTLPPSFSQE